jgi:hypothetical protein
MSETATPLSQQLATRSGPEKATAISEAVRALPDAEKAMVARALAPVLAPPSDPARDRIWLVVVSAFAVVMVGAAAVLGAGVFLEFSADATKQVTRTDTILTVFTTVGGFLAGLLSPSPIGGKAG